MSAEASGRMVNSSVDHGADEAGRETDGFSMDIRGRWLMVREEKGETVVKQLVVGPGGL
jgi:hypothetical protein